MPVKDSKIARVVPSKRLYVPEVGTEFFQGQRTPSFARGRIAFDGDVACIEISNTWGRSEWKRRPLREGNHGMAALRRLRNPFAGATK